MPGTVKNVSDSNKYMSKSLLDLKMYFLSSWILVFISCSTLNWLIFSLTCAECFFKTSSLYLVLTRLCVCLPVRLLLHLCAGSVVKWLPWVGTSVGTQQCLNCMGVWIQRKGSRETVSWRQNSMVAEKWFVKDKLPWQHSFHNSGSISSWICFTVV